MAQYQRFGSLLLAKFAVGFSPQKIYCACGLRRLAAQARPRDLNPYPSRSAPPVADTSARVENRAPQRRGIAKIRLRTLSELQCRAEGLVRILPKYQTTRICRGSMPRFAAGR